MNALDSGLTPSVTTVGGASCSGEGSGRRGGGGAKPTHLCGSAAGTPPRKAGKPRTRLARARGPHTHRARSLTQAHAPSSRAGPTDRARPARTHSLTLRPGRSTTWRACPRCRTPCRARTAPRRTCWRPPTPSAAGARAASPCRRRGAPGRPAASTHTCHGLSGALYSATLEWGTDVDCADCTGSCARRVALGSTLTSSRGSALWL